MDLHDIATEEDVKHLVDSFYTVAMVDDVIGYIFTDVAKISMETHMPIMYRFWSSMLLGTKTYEGNPMGPHIALDKKEHFTQAHFNRWLELWIKTVHENFVGAKANEAVLRAQNIAPLMLYKIEQSR